jgi:hypothetical protein
VVAFFCRRLALALALLARLAQLAARLDSPLRLLKDSQLRHHPLQMFLRLPPVQVQVQVQAQAQAQAQVQAQAQTQVV